MQINFRAATENDIVFLDEVYNENMAALHGIPRTLAYWQEQLALEDRTYYIVYADAPVAWFRTEQEDDILWLGMLQVKPDCQHRGIGRYIAALVERIAKENGFRKIGIHTTEDNTAARVLYLSAGYTVTEIGPCTTADGVGRVGYTFQKDV